MRHARDYADVSGLDGKPSNVGFLGAAYPLGLSPGNLLDIAIVSIAALVIYNWMR